MAVNLERATSANTVLLGNLLELYIHDLSAMFPQVRLGEDGRFGYPELASYLAGSSTRDAFLIRDEDRTAGFALVRRGSPASDDPNVIDVAEFFVLRQFRKRAVGRDAARQLWTRMPGKWTVRASTVNPVAVKFWRGAISAYTNEATELVRSIGNSQWVVFCFDNVTPHGQDSCVQRATRADSTPEGDDPAVRLGAG